MSASILATLLGTQEKSAAEIKRKITMVPQESRHCPHCDFEFREKCYPRMKRDGKDIEDHAEARSSGDYDEHCPECDGVIDQKEQTDEEIETSSWGMDSIKEEARKRRDIQRKRKAEREQSKEAKCSPLETLLRKARNATHEHATEKQRRAGNYAKGRLPWQGTEIAIENPKGSIRRGKDKSGKAWSCELKQDYGYFCKVGGQPAQRGKDKDHVDVFVGDALKSEKVFIIDQTDPDTGKFDEHKVCVCFDSEKAARDGYLSNYSKGWLGLGTITEITISELKTWLKSGDTKKPFAEKGKKASALDQLLQAKGHSDAKRYSRKHAILRKLLANLPEEFIVDSPDKFHPGLTHKPTGFKIHAPKQVAAMAKGEQEKQAVVEKDETTGKWILWTKDKKRKLGIHDKPEDAYKQEYAIQKSMEKSSSFDTEYFQKVNKALDSYAASMPDGEEKTEVEKHHCTADGTCGHRIHSVRCMGSRCKCHPCILLPMVCEKCSNEKQAASQGLPTSSGSSTVSPKETPMPHAEKKSSVLSILGLEKEANGLAGAAWEGLGAHYPNAKKWIQNLGLGMAANSSPARLAYTLGTKRPLSADSSPQWDAKKRMEEKSWTDKTFDTLKFPLKKIGILPSYSPQAIQKKAALERAHAQAMLDVHLKRAANAEGFFSGDKALGGIPNYVGEVAPSVFNTPSLLYQGLGYGMAGIADVAANKDRYWNMATNWGDDKGVERKDLLKRTPYMENEDIDLPGDKGWAKPLWDIPGVRGLTKGVVKGFGNATIAGMNSFGEYGKANQRYRQDGTKIN